MSVSTRVWVGVDPRLKVWDDLYADPETVAGSEAVCRARIAASGRALVPVSAPLVLKGVVRDR